MSITFIFVEGPANRWAMSPPEPIASIDVLIPVFNAAATVQASVASVQSQTVDDIRIILVDDGSTDDTLTILDRLAAADPRVLVLRKTNGGIVDALNHGLRCCSAPLIARLDADDLCYPARFERQADYLRDHPDCLAVGNDVRHIDGGGQPTGVVTTMRQPDGSNVDHYPALEPYLIHPFLMVRRSAIERVGGYRYVHDAEDSDLYWRLAEIGPMHNLPDVLGDYRLHNASISSKSVRSGRICALFSQLAALSARRRRRGAPDLDFSTPSLQRYAAARSIADIVAIGSEGLEADERRQLRLATGTKLLELSFYRLFTLERDDCSFIAAAIRDDGDLLTVDNTRHLRSMTREAATRLACRGSIAAAFALRPRREWPDLVTRTAFRASLPLSWRTRLKGAVRQRRRDRPA